MGDIILKTNKSTPFYIQIYEYFKESIEKDRFHTGEKLPSIRELAKQLDLSKITVERAYEQLFSEGYIEGGNRSRFKVAHIEKTKWEEYPHIKISVEEKSPSFTYNLAEGAMDPEGFDFKLWRKYLNRAVADESRLMRYGETIGELELRTEICHYIHKSRGVIADPNHIIIGSSTQTLLGILAGMLKNEYSQIAFKDPGYKNGRQMFSDYGYEIVPIKANEDEKCIKDLEDSGVKLVYSNPSRQFPTGRIMSINHRYRMLSWAERAEGLIVEDDFDSEFRYYGSPVPALKGLDRSDRVVYMGGFSKMMPPSIRISYMLLPKRLMESFKQKASLYNQTSSTVEQLALAEYIKGGNLDKQIRRLKKLYQEKRRVFIEEMHSAFGNKMKWIDNGTGLFVFVEYKTDKTELELKTLAAEKGCNVGLAQDYSLEKLSEGDYKKMMLYFSSIPLGKMHEVACLLKDAWEA